MISVPENAANLTSEQLQSTIAEMHRLSLEATEDFNRIRAARELFKFYEYVQNRADGKKPKDGEETLPQQTKGPWEGMRVVG